MVDNIGRMSNSFGLAYFLYNDAAFTEAICSGRPSIEKRIRASHMPLPLGHTAVGLIVNDAISMSDSTVRPWKVLVLVLGFSNVPDIDVLIGLLVHGNGNVFHRGPTHSLLLALGAAALASSGWRCWRRIPKLEFLWCFLLILSHVLADAMFSSAPVSVFWPLEVNWHAGYSGWRDVITSIFFGAFRDAGIIFASVAIIVIGRLIRNKHVPSGSSRLIRGS